MLGVPTDEPTALFLESKLEVICLRRWWVAIVCKNAQLKILGINFQRNWRVKDVAGLLVESFPYKPSWKL